MESTHLGRCDHQRWEGGKHRSCSRWWEEGGGHQRHLLWRVVVVGPPLDCGELDRRGSHRHEVDDGEGGRRGGRGWRTWRRLREEAAAPSASSSSPGAAKEAPGSGAPIPEEEELSSGGS